LGPVGGSRSQSPGGYVQQERVAAKKRKENAVQHSNGCGAKQHDQCLTEKITEKKRAKKAKAYILVDSNTITNIYGETLHNQNHDRLNSSLKYREAVTAKVFLLLSVLQYGMFKRPDGNDLGIME